LCSFNTGHCVILGLPTVQADGNSTGTGNPAGYCYKEQPAWSAYREPSFGHGTLDVINATTALWSVCLPFAWSDCPLIGQSVCLSVWGTLPLDWSDCLCVCLPVQLPLCVCLVSACTCGSVCACLLPGKPSQNTQMTIPDKHMWVCLCLSAARQTQSKHSTDNI